MKTHHRTVCVILAVVIAVAVALAGPGGTWLQCRGRQVDGGQACDAVYLVCGARDQDRRLETLYGFLSELIKRETDSDPPLILIGNDILQSRWSAGDGRNLTMSEWAVRKLDAASDDIDLRHGPLRMAIVPGSFYGTFGEMQALAQYLRGRTEIDNIVLTTSPYHVRRCLLGLDKYSKSGLRVHVLAATEEWIDRAPWRVGTELLKILRDRLGWSQGALVSRRSWVGAAHRLTR